jgi:predicted DNA-binding protein (MmcQ/YjbR family)
MTKADYNHFCSQLPHTLYAEQWGDACVWKVGDTEASKLFAAGWFDDGQEGKFTFKCSPISFEFLKETDGCIPAPYLASRGMTWIQCTHSTGLSDEELKAYLRQSYQMAFESLTKKKQKQLAG